MSKDGDLIQLLVQTGVRKDGDLIQLLVQTGVSKDGDLIQLLITDRGEQGWGSYSTIDDWQGWARMNSLSWVPTWLVENNKETVAQIQNILSSIYVRYIWSQFQCITPLTGPSPPEIDHKSVTCDLSTIGAKKGWARLVIQLFGPACPPACLLFKYLYLDKVYQKNYLQFIIIKDKI